MSVTTEVKLKDRFTIDEIKAMREPQRDAIRFQIEGEDGKPKLNAYRVKPEDGIAYCNRECNKLFEKQEGVLRLRVLSRASNTAWKEIALVERTKDTFFDQFLTTEE